MAVSVIATAAAEEPGPLRQERDQLIERGLWKEALAFYRTKLPTISDEKSGEDLAKAIDCVNRLRTWEDADALIESAVEAHAENPWLLVSAAAAYAGLPHQGSIVAGEFHRGYSRSGAGRGISKIDASGAVVSTIYRDRVRGLQLLFAALKHSSDERVRVSTLQNLAENFQEDEAWKVQILTPLDTLPDWAEPGPAGGTEGAPWSKDGPVLFQIPASWETAKNDGERWRFTLAELSKISPALAAESTFRLARFSASQFDSSDLNGGTWNPEPEAVKEALALDSLAEDEVMAKTSDGIRRFKLPADYHFIALLRSIADDPAVGGQAGDMLVQCFIIRNQFTKAEEALKNVIAKHGPGPEDSRQHLLGQITGNWGAFLTADTAAAGNHPKLRLIFRNAPSIKLTAAPIDMDAVLADTVTYLKSNPLELEWEQITPSAIASRIINEKKSKYVGEISKTWEQALEARDGHRETRTEIEVPIEQAGAWWITGQMGNGNVFHTLIWIVDNVLVHRDVAGSKQWWTADALSGAPIAGTEIEFFGYEMINRERKGPLERRMDIQTKSFSKTTDDDGKILLQPSDLDTHFQWMAIARKQGRSTSFFGFQPFQIDEPQFENGNRDIGYGITDRPLYKPGDSLHVKFYLRNVGYFEPDESKYASRSGELILYNGRGEEVLRQSNLRTDELGAVEAEVKIPKDAPLGNWQATFSIANVISSTVNFQVEEFRKPEYEVSVEAPRQPVKLGDKFSVKVSAMYFHGAPVREAEVEILVKRSTLKQRWFPAGRWDWLYGRGSWWPGTDALWHPDWNSWSCGPRISEESEFGGSHRKARWTPDEIVLERKLRIAADGTAMVEVDTAAALEKQGDMDAEYSIEARVVDASRREEKAAGKVIVARKPFEVVVWADHGFSKPGDEIEANVSAATLDGKPVAAAEGTLKLFKIAIDAGGKLTEKETASWPVSTSADGTIKQRFVVPEAGQYRLAAALNLKGAASEGATILNVYGEGKADAAAWKFGAIELVTDKLEYAAGETLKLRVNSDHTDAHVWLFLHVGGSSGRESKRIQLNGKSLELDVPLDRRDMPNMFIEAVTVENAEIHSTFREILMPPDRKLIDVTLEPAKAKVGPREASSLKITLKDSEGNPVVGKVVLSVYDKSLEAITGGSNVAPIQENFWKWKNNYYGGRSSCSVPTSPGNLVKDDIEGMELFENRASAPSQVFFLDRMDSSRARAKSAEPADGFAAPAPAAASAPGPEPVLVRKDFADLMKWSGEVIADSEGKAEVPLVFPDNLTTWKARVWVLGSGTRVGEGSAEIITSKDLLVRLEAPRFLVERDETVISAVVHNDHEEAKPVTVSLEIDGDAIKATNSKPTVLQIAAHSEARVDWRVKASHEGSAKLRMRAVTEGDGDAIERDLPVLVHGMSRQDAWSRVIEPDQESTKISVQVPDKLRPEETKLTIRYSPTIAGAVVDAIPYLASYPHGCTEQTLNRFVPAVIAQRLLKDMQINLADVKNKRTNLNPQELGDSRARAEQWRQWQTNPVFDEEELGRMVKAGLAKISGMQNSDGGWGWFSGFGEQSYPHATAVVMHGLIAGRTAGAEIDEQIFTSGLNWLTNYEAQQIAALKRHVATQELIQNGGQPAASRPPEKVKADALDALIRQTLGSSGANQSEMLDFLYRDRIDLPAYAQALLGLELHRLTQVDKRDEVMAVISQFVKRDAENQTTYLDLKNQGYWWNWYGSETEANAWYLKLLSAVKPNDADTRGLAKYLVNHRKGGSYWESTRDTAFAIEAIADFAKASGEQSPQMEVEVLLDGKSLQKTSISRDNLFSFDGTISLLGKSVTPGRHDIEIRRSGGSGAVYANAYLEVFTLEDRLRAAGLEVKVQRKISKLTDLEKSSEVPDQTGLVVKQTEARVKREPLVDGASLASGDRIEVELILESKNDYEYLLFSDAKAAGFEALDALSGYVDQAGLSVYREPRDRSVDFYLRSLPRGVHTLRYQLRAEAPGVYKAMPATASAMYAPELRGNSADFKIEIKE